MRQEIFLTFSYGFWVFEAHFLIKNFLLKKSVYAQFNGGVHFLYLKVEIPFFGKFGPKKQNCQFKLKFGTETNSIMQNAMVMINFSIFDWKCSFWANLVQKFKIVSLSWNMIPRVIRICKIQWRYSLFLFKTGNTLFWQIWSKKKQNCQFKLKFGTKSNLNMHWFWWW